MTPSSSSFCAGEVGGAVLTTVLSVTQSLRPRASTKDVEQARMAHGLVRLVHDAAPLAGDESRGERHGKP